MSGSAIGPGSSSGERASLATCEHALITMSARPPAGERRSNAQAATVRCASRSPARVGRHVSIFDLPSASSVKIALTDTMDCSER
jgi:hypothetical protein